MSGLWGLRLSESADCISPPPTDCIENRTKRPQTRRREVYEASSELVKILKMIILRNNSPPSLLKRYSFPFEVIIMMYTKIVSIEACIFNLPEECRHRKKSLVMHLLKIAWRMLSWWTCKNIANERVPGPCWIVPLLTRHQYSAVLLSQAPQKDRFPFFLLCLPPLNVSVRPRCEMEHICYCMNTITVERSAAPLVFTNIQRWPLLAPAPGYRAVHYGPLPQALRIPEDVFRETLIKSRKRALLSKRLHFCLYSFV